MRDTDALIFVGAWPFILLSAANIVLLERLVRKWTANRELSVIASAVYAFHAIPLVYGSAAYPRSVSTCCLLVATNLLVDRVTWPRSALAGFVMSIAFAARYSEAIYLVPLVLLTARSGSFRDAGALLTGFGAGVLVTVGAYDRLTWGSPFSSLLSFAEFTLRGESSSGMKMQPFWWYFGRLHEWLSPSALPFFWFAAKEPRVRYAWLLFLVPLAL